MKLDIIAFTSRGAALAVKLMELFPETSATVPEKYCNGNQQPLDDIHNWAKTNFQTGRTLVFIGAAGIAVRAVAPFLKDKTTDAAVICIDENGENIIPLLSGHIGGANQTAKNIAEALGGRVIITTATDINGVFAIDEWAARNNCAVANPSAIKQISAALLDKKEVGLQCDYPIAGELPPGISTDVPVECGIEIALNNTNPFPVTLFIIPRIIVAGIGCQRGVPYERLEEKLYRTLAQFDIPVEAVGLIATIDLKSNEAGLLELCKKLNVGLVDYSARELMQAQGEFEKSEVVLSVTGTDNVCQRAVVCAGAKLFTGKMAENGMAVALGIMDWTVEFC
jgi:cobalt-precorrin 5A hydrolase